MRTCAASQSTRTHVVLAAALVVAALAATSVDIAEAAAGRAVPRAKQAPLLKAYSTCASALSQEADVVGAVEREPSPIALVEEEDALSGARAFNGSFFNVRDFDFSTSRGPYGVGFLTRSARSPVHIGLGMDIFFPRNFPSRLGCIRSIGLIHHASEYVAASDNEWGDHCRLLASYGFICFYSRERVGQFERNTLDLVGGLADRIRDMWRFLNEVENTSTASPLYLRVCRSFGLAGYGLGSNAVLNYAARFNNRRDLKFIAPFHPRNIQRRVLSNISGRLPILTGTGDLDTLSPELEVFESFSSTRSPTLMVVLKDAEHYAGTTCGNSCPSARSCCFGGFTHLFRHLPWLITFSFAYLNNLRHPYFDVIWNRNFGAASIDLHTHVRTVHRFARIVGRPKLRPSVRGSPLPIGRRLRFPGIVAENIGTFTDFDVELRSVSSPDSAATAALCRSGLNIATSRFGTIQLPIDQSIDIDVSVSVSNNALIGSTCSATFAVVNVAVGARTENINLSFQVVGGQSSNTTCGYSEWGPWTETCPCCSTSDLIVIDIVETAGSISRSAADYFKDAGASAGARSNVLHAASTELARLAPLLSQSPALQEPCAGLLKEVDTNKDGDVSVAEAREALRALKRWAGSGKSLARTRASTASEPAMICTRESTVLYRLGGVCTDTIQTKACRDCGNIYDDNGYVNLSPIVNVLVTS